MINIFPSVVFSLDLSKEGLLAAGLLSGDIHLKNCFSASLLKIKNPHSKAVRSCLFNGNRIVFPRPSTNSLIVLISASSDCSLTVSNTETAIPLHKRKNAHNDAINAMLLLNPQLIATGDDSGSIKLRTQKQSMEWSDHRDFISDFYFSESKNTLIATSGDGCLSVMDIRKKKPISFSENQDDELLSISVCKNEKKVLIGSQSGNINIFSWGQWLDSTDRFPGHPASVDTMVKYDEDRLLTGSSDGILRCISILPNKFLNVIGKHEEGLPVEQIKIDYEKKFVASCSHDDTVRFWSLDFLDKNNNESIQTEKDSLEDENNQVKKANKEEEDVDSDDSDKPSRKAKKRKLKQSASIILKKKVDFYDNLD